jgi:hypothetical protein
MLPWLWKCAGNCPVVVAYSGDTKAGDPIEWLSTVVFPKWEWIETAGGRKVRVYPAKTQGF